MGAIVLADFSPRQPDEKVKNSYYVTTTLPYVNADPHIGFAMEITRADVLARFHRLLGEEVFFNTGTDEHGLKIFEEAQQAGQGPQEFADRSAKKFEALKEAFSLSYTNFIRTTDPRHIKAAQEFWRRCDQNGDIYKGKQEIKYCVGCELEKTESELVDEKCPLHPNREITIIEEENYFFRFSRYKDSLLKLYRERPDFVVPGFRLKEIEGFVKSGLKDFSISRLKSKLPWGIEVPGDPEHVMYVWFEALINYVSAIGWPDKLDTFEKWWPGVQIAGKDNLRQQSAMWQAMLISTGLMPSKQIYVEGFINAAGGQKMSKSLGNVIDPFEMVKKYGTDAVRYYLLREIPSYGDGDFSEERFVELYNADLANGLGNLVARVAKLCEGSGFEFNKRKNYDLFKSVKTNLDSFRFDLAMNDIWLHITAANQAIDESKPWKLEGEHLRESLTAIISFIDALIPNLKPFLPETAEIIEKQFAGPTIKSAPPLFPRLEKKIANSLKTSSSLKTQASLVVGKIVELTPHPNADSLQLAKVNIGGKMISIVCGAKNIKTDQLVPVALPGTTVKQPDGKKLKVKRSKIREVESEGMLCSGLELEINQNHDEIYILPPDLPAKFGEELNLGLLKKPKYSPKKK